MLMLRPRYRKAPLCGDRLRDRAHEMECAHRVIRDTQDTCNLCSPDFRGAFALAFAFSLPEV